jgi:hypothetical protein
MEFARAHTAKPIAIPNAKATGKILPPLVDPEKAARQSKPRHHGGNRVVIENRHVHERGIDGNRKCVTAAARSLLAITERPVADAQ